MSAERNIPGADEFVSWFGRWPSFHDAEVISFRLERSARSEMVVHCFQMTAQVNASGHYATEKHALVTFSFAELTGLELIGFNQQNVLSSLLVEQREAVHRIVLGACYGVEGWLSGTGLRMSFVEGVPTGSVYAEMC